MPESLKPVAATMLKILKKEFPDAGCSLEYADPLELLVATILSAQCTDARVNQITPGLFKAFPTVQAFAEAPLAALEQAIHSTGFYRNKAKNIQGAARMLLERFHGVVPDTMDALLSLPGVGRKTANVVLGTAFHKAEGVVVDTHATRLSRRMGWSAAKTPEKIERDLMALFPRKDWTVLTHVLILHGRKYCPARKPRCTICPLANNCPAIGVAGRGE